MFTAGYAYARSYPAAGLHTVRLENRLWQQVLWTSRQKRLQTQQWIRVEERFNRKIANDALQDGYNFNFRFRYLLNLMVPLNRYLLSRVPYSLHLMMKSTLMQASRSLTTFLTKTAFLWALVISLQKASIYKWDYEPISATSFRQPFQQQ